MIVILENFVKGAKRCYVLDVEAVEYSEGNFVIFQEHDCVSITITNQLIETMSFRGGNNDHPIKGGVRIKNLSAEVLNKYLKLKQGFYDVETL